MLAAGEASTANHSQQTPKGFIAEAAVVSPRLQDNIRPRQITGVGIATELPYSDDVVPGLDLSTQSTRYADFDEPRTPGNPFMISNINPSIS